MDRGGWVYILTNQRNGTLYTGVTANLPRRYEEHRSGLGSQFVKKYGLTRLGPVEIQVSGVARVGFWF